jgi:hypothetical protein
VPVTLPFGLKNALNKEKYGFNAIFKVFSIMDISKELILRETDIILSFWYLCCFINFLSYFEMYEMAD